MFLRGLHQPRESSCIKFTVFLWAQSNTKQLFGKLIVVGKLNGWRDDLLRFGLVQVVFDDLRI